MKVFHWSKIPDRSIDQSIWKNLSDNSVKLDENELEMLFNKPSLSRAPIASSSPSAASAAASPKETVPQLLDPKRTQELAILLHQFNPLTPSQVVDALKSCDMSILNEERLKQLSAFVPTPEETETLLSFTGDRSKQTKQEQFYLELVEVPRLKERLKCLLFKTRSHEMMSYLESNYKTIQKACETVSTGKELKKLLELVLAIGNYLNGATNQGCAYGVKLDVLSKLCEFKSTPIPKDAKKNENNLASDSPDKTNNDDNKNAQPQWMQSGTITMLQYIVHVLRSKGGVESFLSEMEVVKQAADMPLSALQQSAAELCDNMASVEKEMKEMSNIVESCKRKAQKTQSASASSSDDENGAGNSSSSSASSSSSQSKNGEEEMSNSFLDVIGPFHSAFVMRQTQLMDLKDKCEKAVTEAMTLYMEDPQKTPSEEFFMIFANFADKVDRTNEDLQKKEDKEKKDREKMERELKKKKEKEMKEQGKKPLTLRGKDKLQKDTSASAIAPLSPSSSTSSSSSSISNTSESPTQNATILSNANAETTSPTVKLSAQAERAIAAANAASSAMPSDLTQSRKDILNAITQQIASGSILRRQREGGTLRKTSGLTLRFSQRLNSIPQG